MSSNEYAHFALELLRQSYAFNQLVNFASAEFRQKTLSRGYLKQKHRFLCYVLVVAVGVVVVVLLLLVVLVVLVVHSESSAIPCNDRSALNVREP